MQTSAFRTSTTAMPAAVAPWLEDLEDEWTQPAKAVTPYTEPVLIVANHFPSSLSNNKSRIPRRSSGANVSVLSDNCQDRDSHSAKSLQRGRAILHTLSSNADNARRDISTQSAVSSGASVSSVVRYDTVDRQAKRPSPDKKQATLEWRKRLVQGELGYGDQTDLFGPSGLENIFQAPAKQSSSPSKATPFQKSRFKRQEMPSSPPPWPSSIDFAMQSSPDRHATNLPLDLNAIAEDSSRDSLQEFSQTHLDDFEQDDDLPHVSDESLGSRVSGNSLHGSLVSAKPTSLPSHSNRNISMRAPVSRMVSGQTEFSNEELSPVYISKHTTINGQVDYTPMDALLAKQMRAVSFQDAVSPIPAPAFQHSASESVLDRHHQSEQEIDDLIDDLLDDTMPSVPEVSLPENLPTGTPPIASLCDFVTTRRGGLSNFGSFKTRPLSPSQTQSIAESAAVDRPSSKLSERTTVAEPVRDDGQLTEKELQQFPQPPTTPIVKDSSQLLSPPKTRSSGSPLKLFGKYDTFTNKRLLRRMSQLEDADETDSHADKEHQEGLSRIEQSCDDRTKCSVSPSELRPGLLRNNSNLSQSQAASKLSCFGEGELDERDFEADFDFGTSQDLEQSEQFSDGSPPPDAMPPGSRTPFRFNVETSQEVQNSSNLKRKLSKRSTAKSAYSEKADTPQSSRSRPVLCQEVHTVHSAHHPVDSARDNAREDEKPMFEYFADGKRPRSSPCKAPTPKRRRTLHAMELENGDQARAPSPPKFNLGSVNGQEITRSSGPRTHKATHSLACSQTGSIRPRNPTPSQTRREELQAEIDEATVAFMSSSPRLEAIKERIESADLPGSYDLSEQAKAVASEVAAFTLNISKATMDGERKRSITTQDFLDEAMHIMAIIRARGRPGSGLGSVEESDAEEAFGQHLSPGGVTRSPSPLRLSRPPSREGPSGWRLRSKEQQDPRVVEQLERFQEQDDLDLVDATFRSLHLRERLVDGTDDVSPEVDTSVNVRISGPHSEKHRGRGDSRASDQQQGDSLKSNLSEEYSTGRTAGTSSTRKSDNVATLAPHSVAHLIPEEVAGMTFDKEKGKWVRLKSPERKQQEDRGTPASNLASDDDPFNNIPDLTIDEAKELHRIRLSHSFELARDFGEPSAFEGLDTESTARMASQDTVVARPVTRDQHAMTTMHSSSVPSRYTAFGSSEPQIETRATSWSNEELACKARAGQAIRESIEQDSCFDPLDLSLDDAEELSRRGSLSRYDHAFTTEEESLAMSDDSPTEEIPVPARRQHIFQSSSHGTYHTATRHVSLRNQTLGRDFHADGQDQSELSIFAELPDKRLVSVSVSVSRPPPLTVPSQNLVIPSSSPARQEATFYLSDLPDFTVHEKDEARPSEQSLARRVAKHTLKAAEDRYALAFQNVVKTLTDVEPEEPYWEDIKQLDLKAKNLASLHGLDEFCTRVHELDVSNNQIAQLEGAPSSLRCLNVRSNALSSLTAWGHLMDLQYVDVSGNDIDSLDGLAGLVHLREIVADDNKITNLESIMPLDGLLKLSIKRNRLQYADFAETRLWVTNESSSVDRCTDVF